MLQAAQSPRLLESGAFFGALVTVALATVVAAMVTGSPVAAAAPTALVGTVLLVHRVPLRWSASALTLALLVLDDTVEAFEGQWRIPLARLGDLLHFRLDAVANIPGLSVTGMELVLVLLFWVGLHRRFLGSRVDTRDQTPIAAPFRSVLLIYVAAVVVWEAVGLARGYPVAPWKLRHLLHQLALALLYLAAFRGPLDHRVLGRVVVIAACYRAVLASVMQRVATAQTGGPFAHATSHGDSILFSVAAFLVIADCLERPTARGLRRAAGILLVLLIGAVDNNRRIFWAMLGFMMVVTFLLGPMKGWRRWVTRALVVALPVAILYTAVGWNRASKIFAPVKTLRGMVDTSTDRSALWREVENWNIAMSMRRSPVIGLGLGGQYTEVMPNDDVSQFYKEYREWPHNAFLGLLLLLGPIGFTAIQSLLGLVLFFSVRAYRRASLPEHRVAALGCVASVIACQLMAWGDLGPRFPQYKVLAALAVAVAARLAVATGAWPRTAAGGRAPRRLARAG